MAKPTYSTTPRSRDDAAEAAEAYPLHPMPTYHGYQEVPQLPSYKDSQMAAEPTRSTGDELIDIQQHQHQHHQRDTNRVDRVDPYPLFGDDDFNSRLDERLMEAEELQHYIEKYLQVTPPRPYFRAIGSHREYRAKGDCGTEIEENRVVDFDITISLQRYLGKPDDPRFWVAFPVIDSYETYRGSRRRSRAAGYFDDLERSARDHPKLADWCRDFCANKSALKVFRVMRIVDGLDVQYIKQNLQRIIRSTHYRGEVELSYNVEGGDVDIYSPHWINRLRLSPWRWLFYLTFLWIFTWPILFLMTKRWQVYAVRWHWSHQPKDENKQREQEQQRADKEFATIGEQRWVELHKNLIMSLVLEKFQGNASNHSIDVPDAQIRRAMGFEMPQESMMMMGGDNGFVDSATSNLVQKAWERWNAMQERQGAEARGGAWGGDCSSRNH